MTDKLCPYCNGPIAIRNPTGNCDHLYYPDNVNKSLKTDKFDGGGPMNPVNFVEGATIWDMYAAAALSSVGDSYGCNASEIAEHASSVADAMMEERKKRGIA